MPATEKPENDPLTPAEIAMRAYHEHFGVSGQNGVDAALEAFAEVTDKEQMFTLLRLTYLGVAGDAFTQPLLVRIAKQQASMIALLKRVANALEAAAPEDEDDQAGADAAGAGEEEVDGGGGELEQEEEEEEEEEEKEEAAGAGGAAAHGDVHRVADGGAGEGPVIDVATQAAAPSSDGRGNGTRPAAANSRKGPRQRRKPPSPPEHS